MSKLEKKEYLPPTIELDLVQMEEGITVGSTVQVGGTGGIDVAPWEEDGTAGNGDVNNNWWE
ncbi:hypothetical protein [Elizabethkingia anophelis]|uniref:hypothetical protein n=1 Tax=Elizabethkingia anophelis TaxID=1117645 RepID=UPI00137133FE|nr:hypothetical protein [Elizabethkingia anophelis]MYY27278.1 hypothetical protein [Elizabethkingia anophelis]